MLFRTTLRTNRGWQDFSFASRAHTRKGLERAMEAQFAEFRKTYPEAERPHLDGFTLGRYEGGRHVIKDLRFDDYGNAWL